LQATVERLAADFNADITVRDRDGALLAHTGDALPLPAAGHTGSGWTRPPGGPPLLALHLGDGRWVMGRAKHRRHGLGLLGALLGLAGALALGAYPVARRIAGRLERLQARVDALGAAICRRAFKSKAATKLQSLHAPSIAPPIASSVS
jgi:hypothetical protein